MAQSYVSLVTTIIFVLLMKIINHETPDTKQRCKKVSTIFNPANNMSMNKETRNCYLFFGSYIFV